MDKRIEENTKSVTALANFLREVIQGPASIAESDAVILALKSQGALSKFADERRGISSSSINTLKRISESCIPGGFDALDRLRINAREALVAERSRLTNSKRTDKIGLTNTVNCLKADKLLLLQDLARLTNAFQKSLRQGRNYAQQANNQFVLALCIREQRELLDELSLMHTVPENVVPISRP